MLQTFKKFFTKTSTVKYLFMLLIIAIAIRYLFTVFSPNISLLPHIQHTIFGIIVMYVSVFMPLLLVPIAESEATKEVRILKGGIIGIATFAIISEVLHPTGVESRSDMLYICILLILGVFQSKSFLKRFISFKNRESENCIE